MANNNSAAGSIGKGVLGFDVGFALLYLLRLGGGFGLGGRRGEEGAGRGPEVPSPAPGPPQPRDAEPLLFVVFHPEGFKERDKAPDPAERARRDAAFKQIDLGAELVEAEEIYRRAGRAIRDAATRPLSIDEVAARVKAGGRDDVRLVNMGSIRSGTWDDALMTLTDAGINHWRLWQEAPADRKPGSAPTAPVWDLYMLREKVTPVDPTLHPQPTFSRRNGGLVVASDTSSTANRSGQRYIWDNRGTAHWNLAGPGREPPLVSGNDRGHYGRAYR